MELEEAFKLLAGGGSGPVAWCKFCSRVHPRRAHPATFQQVERITQSGRKRLHWAHVPVEPKKRKMKARKS